MFLVGTMPDAKSTAHETLLPSRRADDYYHFHPTGEGTEALAQGQDQNQYVAEPGSWAGNV